MEKELGREFVVFPLEPCPGRCSREVRSRQGRRTPRLSGRFLPRAPSCSQALFLGSFSHSPPRSISSPLSLERSRMGAGRGGGSRGGFRTEPGTPWEVGNEGAGSGHQTRSCCQFVMFSLKSQRFNGKRGQALT